MTWQHRSSTIELSCPVVPPFGHDAVADRCPFAGDKADLIRRSAATAEARLSCASRLAEIRFAYSKLAPCQTGVARERPCRQQHRRPARIPTLRGNRTG